MTIDRYDIRFDRDQTRWVITDESGVMVAFFRWLWQAETYVLEDLVCR